MSGIDKLGPKNSRILARIPDILFDRGMSMYHHRKLVSISIEINEECES